MADSPNNRRDVDRAAGAALFYPLQFVLRGKDWEMPSEVVNFHFRGACLKINSDTLERITSNRDGVGIDCYVGSRKIQERVPFRLAWESVASDGLIGVEFLKRVHSFSERAPRFNSHPHFAPSLTAWDPLDPNRRLFFRVCNLSENGMLLLSSLSNKHLLPGMNLNKSQLLFPGQAPCELDLVIQNARPGPDAGSFYLGVSIVEPQKAIRTSIDTYVAMLTPATEGGKRVEQLAEEQHLPKKIKEGLSFRIISTNADYERLLKLRYAGYLSHNKVRPGSSWRDQGEGLEKEGTIICAFLGGEMIASMELRFGREQKEMRLMKLVGNQPLPDISFEEVVEINKLVVHPSAQGSDIVVGMIQKAHAILVRGGGFHVLIGATDNLAYLYERIGFKKLGVRVPHPSVSGLFLNFMVLRKEVYLEAKRINAYSWVAVYQATQKHLEDFGVARPFSLKFWQRMQVLVSPYLLKLKHGRRVSPTRGFQERPKQTEAAQTPPKKAA